MNEPRQIPSSSGASGGGQPLTFVPPGRLARILTQTRCDRSLDLDQLAARSGGRFSVDQLAGIERGSVQLQDADILALGELYGVGTTAVVPERGELVIDLDEGRLHVGERSTGLPGLESSAVLGRYLSFVYAMRHVPAGTPIPLRVEDLDVLGVALHQDRRTVTADLEALMRRPAEVQRLLTRIRHRVLVPTAGLLVAVTAAGALVMVVAAPGPSASTTLASAAESEVVEATLGTSPVDISTPEVVVQVPPVEIGDAIVQEPGKKPEVRKGD